MFYVFKMSKKDGWRNSSTMHAKKRKKPSVKAKMGNNFGLSICSMSITYNAMNSIQESG